MPTTEAEESAYGIINPYGDLWSPRVFETPDQAAAFLAGFWSRIQSTTFKPDEWKIAPVKHVVTVTGPAAPLPINS